MRLHSFGGNVIVRHVLSRFMMWITYYSNLIVTSRTSEFMIASVNHGNLIVLEWIAVLNSS